MIFQAKIATLFGCLKWAQPQSILQFYIRYQAQRWSLVRRVQKYLLQRNTPQLNGTNLTILKMHHWQQYLHYLNGPPLSMEYTSIFQIVVNWIGTTNLCGQSYKHFMIVIYDPTVVIWGVFKSGMTRVVIYERKLFIRLATGVGCYNNFCTAKERTNFGLFDGSSGQRISLINISFGVRFLLHRVEKMQRVNGLRISLINIPFGGSVPSPQSDRNVVVQGFAHQPHKHIIRGFGSFSTERDRESYETSKSKNDDRRKLDLIVNFTVVALQSYKTGLLLPVKIVKNIC